MILSQELTFSYNQAITGDAVSTNVIDLGATGTVLGAPAALKRDIGKGNPVPILIQVTEDFDELTSLKVLVQKDTVENFGSPEVCARSEEVLLASLVAGYRFAIIWLPEGVDQRYLRLSYDVTGNNPTTGKITATIPAAVQTNDRAPGA